MNNKKITKRLTLSIFLILFYLPISLIFYITLTKYNPINEILSRQRLLSAIFVSLTTSIISTIISVMIATFAAVGLPYFDKKTRIVAHKSINLPLIFPDIVIGIGLLSVFMLFFGKGSLGWTTLILAHISFSMSYAFIVIYPKAKRIGKMYYEASEDLGATPLKTFFYVILPNLKTSIISASAIAFAMSFDDYIISKLSGGLLENISSYLVSSKRIISRLPGIYSFTTIMIIVFAVIVLATKVYNYKNKGEINNEVN